MRRTAIASDRGVLFQSAISPLLDPLDDVLALSEGRFHRLDLEAYGHGAGVGQRVDGAVKIKCRLADLHAQTFRFSDRRLSAGDLLVQSIQSVTDLPGGQGAGNGCSVLPVRVASDTNRACLHPDQLVRGQLDTVTVVTRRATGSFSSSKRCFIRVSAKSVAIFP